MKSQDHSILTHIFFFKLKFLSFSYYSGEDNPANLPQQQQEQGREWISFGLDWCEGQSEKSLA